MNLLMKYPNECREFKKKIEFSHVTEISEKIECDYFYCLVTVIE